MEVESKKRRCEAVVRGSGEPEEERVSGGERLEGPGPTYLADAELVSESGDRIPVHRLILALHSPYIRALFFHSPETSLIRADVATSVLVALLDVVYNERLQVELHQLQDLVKLADLWAMDLVLRQVAEYIIRMLDKSNALAVWRMAELYPRLGIALLSRRLLLFHLEELLLADGDGAPDELIALTASEMRELLDDDWLRLSSEEALVDIVVRWTKVGAVADRKKAVPSLISRMRASQGTAVFRHQWIRKHFQDFDIGGGLQSGALQLDPASIAAFTAANPKPARFPQEVIIAVGGWSHGQPTRAIEAYDLNTNTWNVLELGQGIDGVQPCAYHGMAQVEMGGDVYLVGGFDGSDCYNSVRVWKPETGEWRRVAPMNAARCYVSVAVLDGVLYALGGFDGRNRLASAEKYEPDRNQWTLLPKMRAARSDASAVSFKGRVYVIGGFDGHAVLESVECWDPVVGVWEEAAPLASPRSGVSAVVAEDGAIWVYGGFDGSRRLSSGERYESEAEGWSKVPPMLSARSNFALLALSGPAPTLLAIGGYNGQQTIASVEELSLRSGRWRAVCGMRVSRSALKALVLRGLPDSFVRSAIRR